MLHNYLKIALRSLRKQKFYTVLNIAGLSLGIASTLLILLYIADEWRYDRFHEHADRIFRVAVADRTLDPTNEIALTYGPLASTMLQEFPEVAAATRVLPFWEVVRYERESFIEQDWLYADSSFFVVFGGFELLQGDAHTVLRAPNTVVLTETTAKKYFGNQPAVGKLLLIGKEQTPYTVTGIAQDPPDNAHFDFTLVASILSQEKKNASLTDWAVYGIYTYLLLNEGANAAAFKDKTSVLTGQHIAPALAATWGVSEEELNKPDVLYLFLQPITDIYLYSDLLGEMSATGDINALYIFALIGFFVLLLACINFMNLSTARYTNRAKEVGIRKTLGSQKTGLMAQFFTESILMSTIATLLAVGLALALLRPFNAISGKALSFSVFTEPWLLVSVFLLMLLVGLVAGSYPAFYLASFRPAEVLKGGLLSRVKGKTVRHVLVVFQFAISIGLIICTLLVFQQLEYQQTKNPGFDRENVVIISNADQLGQQVKTFRQQLEEQSGIVQASVSHSVVPYIQDASSFRKKGADKEYMLEWTAVDYRFLDTYNMKLLEGRNFSPDYAPDTTNIIINEAAVKTFELDEPVGSVLTYTIGDEEIGCEVIGVVQDFHYKSLHHAVQPLALFLADTGNFVSARLAAGDPSNALAMLKSEWKSISNNAPLEYSFLDEDYDRLFRAEQRLSKIFFFFTGVAIFIACLGLLGLAAFSTQQRTKEIGVRKVMGASSGSVMLLLTKDFTRLVLIAFVVATPLAYYAMHWWLLDFAYHISIGAGVFVIAGILALITAWLTVSYQSYKAANADPAQSLRSE